MYRHGATYRLLGCAVVLWLSAGIAHADPTLDFPSLGRRPLSLVPADRPDVRPDVRFDVGLALTGEIGVLALLGTEPGSDDPGPNAGTSYPDVGQVQGIAAAVPVARIGVVGMRRSLAFSLRADLSEALRVRDGEFAERPLAAITRFVDDAALFWRPRVWARFVLGRFKVPFSRYRQLERSRLTAGSVPFVVDRIAPERRWGGTVHGDLGSLAYALGGYADIDALEPRGPSFDPYHDDPRLRDTGFADPSSGGRFLVSAFAWWTPVGPIGVDHMAKPASDPWYRVLRPAAGIGLMWRVRPDGVRLDATFSTQIGYRNLSAMAEFYTFLDGDRVGFQAAGQASVLMTRRFALFGRGEWDGEARIWSAGGGLSYFATRDRRTKVSAIGWVRRDVVDGPRRDGATVYVQAAL